MSFKVSVSKIVKNCIYYVMTLFFIVITSITVNAESTKEEEPNNTIDMAQMISANNETAEGTINRTYDGQHTIKGYTSKTDPDCFKVYLNAGVNYLTCNGDEFDFEITDINGNIVRVGTYTKTGTGPTAYSFDINTSDYYYLNIVGVSSFSSSYLFLIGSPSYTMAKAVISCSEGTVNMQEGLGNQVVHFVGEAQSFPEEAIAYSVCMTGLRTDSVSGIQLRNETRGRSVSLRKYLWDIDGVFELNMPVASVWTATLEYNRPKTFTPTLTIYYVYPVHSTTIN